MRNISIFLSLLFVLSTCKKDEDTSILVNASVANSSEGSVDFKSGDYSIGSSVTFSATPKTGYVFSNWTNTSTNQTYTTNPLSITVNENTTLVANFEKAAYNVMFTISGDGSVQKEVVGGGGYTHGSQVKLTATPSDDYSFFYWNNDPGDTENPKTITLDSNQNIPAKFDYEVARNLVGNWEFEISDPASKNVTIIKMSIDIFLNVLMTTIVNGEVISQIFTQMITISSTAIVIGDFAVITDVVVASATSLSMNMISIPEDTAPPTNESEIPDTGSELNLSGNKSDEEPQKDEDGIIIPPTDATTSSSTTEDIGDVFDESFDKLVNEAVETTTNTSTVEDGSFLDRVNGKTFTSETNDYTAVFEFTNDILGEFIKFHMIYDDCGETLINGSNIVAVTRNTENEFWFTFSINSENNSTARADQILAEMQMTFEDMPSANSDDDENDLKISILFPADEENSEFTEVIPSITPIAAGALNNLRLIIDNQCNATEINTDKVSGVRLIEQNVCLGENVEPYELVFRDQGFDRLINNLSGAERQLFNVSGLRGVFVNFKNGDTLSSINAGSYSNYYGIEYKCKIENSAINSDQDNNDCDITEANFGGLNRPSFVYTGVITDTTVSSIIHRIFNGSDEIRFVTNIKPESECNSSTTDTTTTTNTGTTSSTASGGGGNSGTTSSTGGGGNNSGTSSTTSLNFNCSDKAYIPDDNFESELISLGFDDVMDNYVCKNNINTITSLDLRAKSISNLTGVNSFTALENLDISHNNLGNSVLISNLGQLQILKARSSGITSIDLSNNPNLSTLDIDYNPITTLDVSSLNNLIKLWCGNTKLTNLNISNNVELTELRCQNNSNTGKYLTDLDLSNNSKITWLQLSYQKISFLDITSLPDSIETFLLNDNSELECVKATSIQINNRRDCLGGPQGWCIPDGVELSPNCNSGTTSNTSGTNSSTTTTNTTDTSTSTNTGTTSSTGGGGNNSGTTSNTSGTNSSTSTNNNCTISSSITSAQGSDNQTVVQGNQLQTITYSISSDCDQLNDAESAGQQLVSGFPPGVTALLSGNTVTISGTPTSQASGNYNYTIIIDNSIPGTETEPYISATSSTTIIGVINVEAPASLVLSSNQNTLNQSVCNNSDIDPVVFQLGGNATLANVTGLPSGITSTLDGSLNTITLGGSPSVSVATSTTYVYNISNTDGSPTRTVTGVITVHPPSQITRTSGDANIVVNSRTDGQENQLTNTSFSLSFQIGNAVGYNLTWDDNSIFNSNVDAGTPDATFDPNTGVLTISGNPGATGTTVHPPFKTYNYTITTTGNNNGCAEVSISGSIELVDGYVPAETYTINVTASSASDYTLSGSDRNGNVTGNDPSVTIKVGDTVDFAVDASGHPFYLKTVQGTGTSDLISGVTNNGATNGTVSWTPTTAGTYYYQCSLHNGMYGTITVN